MPTVAKPRKPHRAPRTVKFEQARKALIAAAADIIGEEGYQACSVAKVTPRAKVEQDAFARHLQSARSDYVKLPRLATSRGELQRYGDDEPETLAVMQIALRSFIGPRFIAGDLPKRIPARIRKTFLRFLEHGLGNAAKR